MESCWIELNWSTIYLSIFMENLMIIYVVVVVSVIQNVAENWVRFLVTKFWLVRD